MKMIKRNLETEAEDFNVKKPVLAEVSRAFPNVSGPRPPSPAAVVTQGFATGKFSSVVFHTCLSSTAAVFW